MLKSKFCFIILIITVFLVTVVEAEEQNQIGITAYGTGDYPIGEFRSFSNFGVGGGVAVDLGIFPDDTPLASIKLKAELSALYNKTAQDKFTSLGNLQWAVGAVYIIPLMDQISSGVGVSYGGIFHMLKVDSIIDGEVPINFYDQTVNIQADAMLNLSSKVQIIVSPGYQFFFETDYLGQQVYLKTGVRMSL